MINILIGDDQYDDSPAGQHLKNVFQLMYGEQLQGKKVEYTSDPQRFIELARTQQYQVLMCTLH